MPYIQIGLIHTDDLPQDQKAWVETQWQEEMRQNLAYIIDGDASLIHEINKDAESPENIASEIKHNSNGRRVTVTLIDEDYNKEVLELFRSLLREDDTVTKGYWGRSLDFCFED